MVGLGSAAAGLGAIMLGASGPVGWAVAGVVALGSFVVGMSQTQNGIGSLKEETKEWEEAQANMDEALANTQQANYNYNQSLFSLKQLEDQTGLSGKALADAVDSGKLSVENMTTAQLAVYDAYMKTVDSLKQLTEARKISNEAVQTEAKEHTDVLAKNAEKSGSYDELAQHINDCWMNGTMSTETARDEISRIMAGMNEDAREQLLAQLQPTLQEGLDPQKYESGWSHFGQMVEKDWTRMVGVWDKSCKDMKVSEEELTASTIALETAHKNLEDARLSLSNAEKDAGMTYEELQQKIEDGTIDINDMTTAQKNLIKEYNNYTNKSAQVDQALDRNSKNVSALAWDAYEASGDWKTFVDTLKKANDDGQLSTERMEIEIGKSLADMSGSAQRESANYLKEMGLMTDGVERECREQEGFLQGLWKKATNWLGDMGQKLKNVFSGKGWKTDNQLEMELRASVGSYAVGTNYVPNDQLAMIHKGEAIVPAKYNNPSTFNGGGVMSQQMVATISAMNNEITNLRSLIQQGIPISGTFTQRGSDLVATVEKAKSRNGSQPLSNAAFAR